MSLLHQQQQKSGHRFGSDKGHKSLVKARKIVNSGSPLLCGTIIKKTAIGEDVNNLSRNVVASMLGLVIVLLSLTNVQAAELRVLAGGAMTKIWDELKPKFEHASGHKLIIRFGTTPELIQLATTGGPFDLGVVPREVFKDAAAKAQFVAGPTTDVAGVGLGVAVRSGTSKPDISTPDALKQTLLKAKSIATIPASAAGAQVLSAFERLGIGDAMKAKTKAQPTPAKVVEVVANGDAELGVFLINVLTAPGLDVVGPFPGDLQQVIMFTAALSKDTKETLAAQSLITYLKTPEVAAIIKAKGMMP
jgi:molybdate transport system substrate-binding protein